MHVRPLPRERDREAVALLTEAFLEYPTWDAVAPRSSAPRRAMIRRYYRSELAVGRRFGGTILAAVEQDRLLGVALAFDPGRYPAPQRSLLWFAPLLLAGAGATARALRSLSAMDAGHPREPHLFLHTVAADPAEQRQGVGRALIEHVTARADRLEQTAYLITSREELVDYYRGFGFAPSGEALLPRGVRMWGMLREAGQRGGPARYLGWSDGGSPPDRR